MQDIQRITDKVYVFDTTLRDGEQAPGNQIGPRKKLEIAKALAGMGVDYIEAGFAISSPGDDQAVRLISEQVGTPDGPTIVSLAMATEDNVLAAVKALEHAAKKRIHTFIATSDQHIAHKLRSSRDEVIVKAVKAVELSKRYVDDVQFSFEDFSRTDMAYAIDVGCAVIAAGAGTVNLPDTVGILTPFETYAMVTSFIDGVRGRGYDAVFSFHGHDDFGMATANTIAAIYAGARQVEVAVNGIGERAGNTPLEEVVMAMRKKGVGVDGVDARRFSEVSALVSEYFRSLVPRNKAIVGRNAFRHTAGIHLDGVLKDMVNYESIAPEEVGAVGEVLMSARTGRKGLQYFFKKHGIPVDGGFEDAYRTFLAIADDREVTDDADIFCAASGITKVPAYIGLKDYAASVTQGSANVVITVEVGGTSRRMTGHGHSQVMAGIDAVERAIGQKCGYEMHQDPFSPTTMVVSMAEGGYRVEERHSHPDPFVASMHAYVGAVNRMLHVQKGIHGIQELSLCMEDIH